MIRLLLLLLVFFIGGIWLFEQIQNDPGYVLISLNGKTLETSFWFSATVLFSLLCGIYILWRIIRRVVVTLMRGRHWYSHKRSLSVEQRYREGLLNFLTGEYKLANKQLSAVSRRNELPVVRAIANAQSLAKSGEIKKAISLLEDAQRTFPQDKVWILKAQLPLLLDAGMETEADILISELKLIGGAEESVSKFEHLKLTHKQNWQGATKLLANRKVVGSLEDDVLIETYANAISELKHSEKYTAADIDSLWHAVPKKLKFNARLLCEYAYLLQAAEQYALLEELIVFTLGKQWLPELVDVYAKIPSPDTNLQLKKAERWLKTHPHDQSLLLTLGVLAIKNQLWGKAKTYFESANNDSAHPRAIYFLGYLAEKQGDQQQANMCYKKAAEMSV